MYHKVNEFKCQVADIRDSKTGNKTVNWRSSYLGCFGNLEVWESDDGDDKRFIYMTVIDVSHIFCDDEAVNIMKEFDISTLLLDGYLRTSIGMIEEDDEKLTITTRNTMYTFKKVNLNI